MTIAEIESLKIRGIFTVEDLAKLEKEKASQLELTKEKFNIPAKYQPELLLPIGYIDRKPSILHTRRKPIRETVQYDKY